MAEVSAQDTAQKPQIRIVPINQFIRDLSFENILAQKNHKGEANPQISVNIGLDARQVPDSDVYEVAIKVEITSSSRESDAKFFVMEMDYAGYFRIENVEQDQLHPILMIECPRILFPFLRRAVSDITRDGGFQPLNLEIIDFVQMFRMELERRQKAQEQTGAETANGVDAAAN